MIVDLPFLRLSTIVSITFSLVKSNPSCLFAKKMVYFSQAILKRSFLPLLITARAPMLRAVLTSVSASACPFNLKFKTIAKSGFIFVLLVNY